MGLESIVNVTITTSAAGLTQAGFGTPLILSYKPTWIERTRTYTETDALLSDGFVTSDPEYKAAVALCSQTPRPERFMIGRGTNKPTMKYRIDVSLVRNSTAYKLNTSFGVATATSDASATNDEVVALLVTAVNSLAGNNYLAAAVGSAGSQYVEVTADNPGDWFSLEVVDVGLLALSMTHAAPDVAGDLAAIKVASEAWYGLLTLYNSEAYVLAAAAWIEANKRLYCAASCDTIIITTAASGGTDVASDLKTAAYFRTIPVYHPSPLAFADAALFGRQLPLSPGSETWKFVTLAGVPAVTFTATHLVNAADKNALVYYTLGGVNITAEGKVASGEWIDVVRFRDWLVARLQERIFALFVNASAAGGKVPFTSTGIVMIEGEIYAQLDDGIAVGGLASDPAPTVTVPKIGAVSPADKAARRLTGVKFTAVLAGAIHAVVIKGTVTS